MAPSAHNQLEERSHEEQHERNLARVLTILVVLCGVASTSWAESPASPRPLLSAPDILLKPDAKTDRQIKVEIQDENTSLVQDIDPKNAYFQVTVQEGNQYQVLSFAKRRVSEEERERTYQRGSIECSMAAVIACGEGNVEDFNYRRHLFGSCCSFECTIPQEGEGPV